MNTKRIATVTTAAVLAIVVLLLAIPTMAASTAPKAPKTSSLPQSANPQDARLAIGQAFTLTSISGGYREIGDPAINGTASGSLTFQVKEVFKGGYSLSVTGGQLSFDGTIYTVTAGTAELGPHGVHMVGQAEAGSSAQMIFDGRNLGRFGETNYGTLRVDLASGSREFGIKLLVTITTA